MRYTSTGQDNWQARCPSGLTREQIHGELLPMDPPVRRGRRWLALAATALAAMALLLLLV